MRQVMTSDQVCHAWAHQRQEYARNGCQSLYFRGDTIYSYGSHFPIARHLPNGSIAFTTQSYSVTTSGHKSSVRRAIPHNTPVLYVYDPTALPGRILEHTQGEVKCLLEKAAKATKRKADYLEQAQAVVDDFNAYAEALSCPERIEDVDVGQDLADLRRDILAREEAARKAKRERDLKLAQELAEKIKDWRNHGDTETWQIRQAAPALRLSYFDIGKFRAPDVGESSHWVVETSWGARVPVADAKRLWPLIQRAKRSEQWRLVPGKAIEVGGYWLTKINADGSIVVGCHEISYSEIEYIAGKLGLLETAEQSA